MSDIDMTETIPPTEPTAKAKPAKKKAAPRKRKSRAKPKATIGLTDTGSLTVDSRAITFATGVDSTITYNDQQGQPKANPLAPDFNRHTEAIFVGRWYWLGIFPDLENIELVHLGDGSFPQLPGVGGAYIGGVSFQKMLHRVSRSANGKTNRAPVFGDTIQLTKSKVELITKKIGNTIIRWRVYGDPATPGPIAISNVGTPGPTGKMGKLITIPDDEYIAALAKQGRSPRNPYQRQAEDTGIYEYLYCVPCDGPNARGLELPPPLSETGLTWEE